MVSEMVSISLKKIVSGDNTPEDIVYAAMPMTKTITNDLRSPPPSRDNEPKPQFPENAIPSPNKTPPIMVSMGENGIFQYTLLWIKTHPGIVAKPTTKIAQPIASNHIRISLRSRP